MFGLFEAFNGEYSFQISWLSNVVLDQFIVPELGGHFGAEVAIKRTYTLSVFLIHVEVEISREEFNELNVVTRVPQHATVELIFAVNVNPSLDQKLDQLCKLSISINVRAFVIVNKDVHQSLTLIVQKVQLYINWDLFNDFWQHEELFRLQNILDCFGAIILVKSQVS